MPDFIVRPKNGKYPEAEIAGSPRDHYVEITDGPYVGLHFNYGNIEFAGENEDGSGNLNFNYTVLFTPRWVNSKRDIKKIEVEIGVVLQAIIEKYVQIDKNVTPSIEALPTPHWMDMPKVVAFWHTLMTKLHLIWFKLSRRG